MRRPLSAPEAYVVLEPYYEAVRERFVAEGFERCRHVTLEIAPWVHDSERHFAATAPWGKLIVAAPELADLPDDSVLAILGHEFGHATDFLYPGDFVFRRDAIVRLAPPDPEDKRQLQAHTARMRFWKERDDDLVERTADAIGEGVLGRQIGYCGPCRIQCFDRGCRRPDGLR
jgi:hypothetical protein